MAKIQVRRGVTVDPAGFLAHIADFCKIMGRGMGPVLLDQSGKFCSDMIKFTRPFTGKSPGNGDTGAAKKKGIENITASVYKIFAPIEKATAYQIADLNDYGVFKLWNRRAGTKSGRSMKWTQFQPKFARGNSYGFIPAGGLSTIGQVHTQAREDGGHGPLKSMYRNMKGPIFIVAKESDLKKYIKQKTASVGRLKSAYAFAAAQIGSKESFKDWTRNPLGAKYAIGINQVNDLNKPSVTVGNSIGLKGMRGGLENYIQIAINARAYAMRVQMAQELNKRKLSVWGAYRAGDGLASHKYF